MNQELKQGDIVVVDLDPLSHGDPVTALRTKFEILKLTDTDFEIESADGENVVHVDVMAVAKVLEMVEWLHDGGIFRPDDEKTHGHLEIWYCTGGKWRSVEFGFPELEFLDEEERLLPPGDARRRHEKRRRRSDRKGGEMKITHVLLFVELDDSTKATVIVPPLSGGAPSLTQVSRILYAEQRTELLKLALHVQDQLFKQEGE